MNALHINGNDLTLEAVREVAVDRRPVLLLAAAREAVDRARAVVDEIVSSNKLAYAVTTLSLIHIYPYGDLSNVDEVIEAISLMEVDNLRMISLADTVGMATPEQITDLVGAVMAKYDYLEIGVHLHSRPEQAAAKVLAAYDAGCRRFDSAIGGLGGCPFAQDALVGNIATEKVIAALKQRGAQLPPLKPLDALLRATSEIGARYTNSINDEYAV